MSVTSTSETSLQRLLGAPLYCSVEDVDRTLVEEINQRRKALVRHFRATCAQWVIDSYHGEMGFPLHPDAANVIVNTLRALVDCTHPLSEPNGMLYSKEQPAILQKLSAERLFDRFRTSPPKDGFPTLEEVLVIPYLALAMFEAVMAALTTESPQGIVLVPPVSTKNIINTFKSLACDLSNFILIFGTIAKSLQKSSERRFGNYARMVKKSQR